MRLMRGCFLTLAEEGRLTLQTTQYYIGADSDDYVDYPDEYFMELKIIGSKQGVTRYRAACGREEGFLYLTRTGFEHFKADMKQAFNKRVDRGNEWADFENYAYGLFPRVRVETEIHLKRMEFELSLKHTPYNQKRVDDLKDVLANL